MTILEILHNFYAIEILTTGILTFISFKAINIIFYLYNTDQTLKHIPVNPAIEVKYFLGLLPFQKTSHIPRELTADLLYEGAKKLSEKERNGCPLGITKIYMIPGWPSLIFSHGDVTTILFRTNNVIEKNPMLKTVTEGMFGVGLVTMNAADWRQHRRALVKMMHSDLHVDYGTAINKHNKRMIGEFKKMIQKSDEKEKSIDLLYHDHEFDLTLNVAAEIIFGQGLDDEQQKKEFLKRFNNLVSATEARMFQPILCQKHLWRLYNWWKGIDYTNLVRDYDDMVETLMSTRLDILKKQQSTENGKPKNKMPTLMADKLIQLYNEKSITYQEMQAHAKTFFLAALDTTSNTVIGAVYSLSHPDNRSVQQKLIEEIDNNFPNMNELDNFAGIADNLVDAKMPYLNGVISEALRIYMPASMIGRQLVPGVDLKFNESCKIKINNSANFRINGLLLLKQIMSHEIGSDTEKRKFKPERWTDGELDRKNFSYAPLGRGVRDCIGRPVAFMMMRLTLLHLYKNFRTELVIKSEKDKIHYRKMKMNFLYEIDEQPTIRFFNR